LLGQGLMHALTRRHKQDPFDIFTPIEARAVEAIVFPPTLIDQYRPKENLA
jgi:hypothetical protein